MGFVAKPTLRRVLDRLGALATLLLPLFLVHWRGIAEGCLDGLAVGFLLRTALTRDWSWCRQGFVWPTLVWWGWLVLCSLPRQMPVPAEATASLTQALLAIRFPLAAFALAFWTLQESWTRTWCRRLVIACVLYLGGQMLLQAVTGHNLFGNPRFGDGTLTGPYDKPRVSAPFALLGLPAALFVGALLGERVRRSWQKALVTGVTLLPVLGLLVLAGQRMSLATFLLGTGVCALVLPSLRRSSLALLVASPALIGLLAFVSPEAFGHLVTKTQTQLLHFASSPYGQIYNRAAVMIEAHPALGLGDDAFRHYCRSEEFLRPGPSHLQPDGAGVSICVQHTHNHVLEAATNSGLPGAALFVAMIGSWWLALGRTARRQVGLSAEEIGWRVGLFGAAFLHEWPLSSQSAFLNMPLGGIAFLLLGAGLAEAVRDLKADRPDDGETARGALTLSQPPHG
ncbi:O-antigen ligase family protein [Gluconobacter oxydans]|uniref:O-antigen ligase family protein n=1 Tax=Gluconobacter oxydans TaxID=442 RepID=UPI00209FC463|nr:O-antigen ligase family protein [Gluconobacter oxydans]MCP1249613.1 O-antigen ligase family protein [Gluconobacter oxydans]